MKRSGAAHVALICWVAFVVVCGVKETTAVTCDVRELIPCTAAMVGSGVPSALCCQKLREQVPCLCTYMKDPSLAPYVKSPNGPKVAATCGISIPIC
ncbi:hypothetical protein F511_13339 [Dorcoceras hygrometricum]|uniref:Bifunctional inhibitor/plant lipid transfer protein/seed storage helical domain-containing protein n=1 Tax=Dorcoceras hygrometricum TaxID=472368 RepID=A0A2Z7CC24_9LAMI|nr:hypothetical protein F511_13339 [Dorcoceras hygrometricum]